MPAQRVLVVDENQTFCNQVVAAFSEAGIDARGSARGNEALMLAASFRPDVVVVDLVRPGSEGRWLLGRLCAQNDEAPVALVPRAVLALAPVAGDYSDLPDGVEVMVKPIFPSQVVASARRLLGPLSGHALAAGPLSGGRQQRPLVKTPSSLLPPPLPRSGSLGGLGSLPASERLAIEHTAPPGARPLDPFDDDSDFGPADTLLAPAASINELARSMALIPDSAPRPRPRPAAPAAPGPEVGEATMPIDHCLEVSGCSAGLPPWRAASGYVGLTMLLWSPQEGLLSCTDARPESLRGFDPVARYRAMTAGEHLTPSVPDDRAAVDDFTTFHGFA